MTIKGLKQTDVDYLNKQDQISSIVQQLSQLDSQVPRIVEDILPLVSGLSINSSKQAIIDKKISLRIQLGSLNGS